MMNPDPKETNRKVTDTPDVREKNTDDGGKASQDADEEESENSETQERD